MAFLGRAITTSTPKPGIIDSTVLREKKWQNIVSSGEKDELKSEIQEKKVKIRTDKFKSKENRRRSPNRRNQPPRKGQDDFSSKRRKQAVEAMQIAEQRRRRMVEEEKLAENLENLNISATEYLPDGRLKLTRQQLIARNQKRKRIEHHLKEQEERKKHQAKNGSKKTVTFKKPETVWTPYPNPSSTRPKAFQYPTKVSPVATTSTAAAEEDKKQVKKADEKENQQLPSTSAVPAGEEVKKETKKPAIIRYTKDELRELNPYGYYYM